MLEKGKQPGSHLLSGAVVNPRALRRLFGEGFRMEDLPSYGQVHGESVYVLTRKTALPIPPPPPMRNHGNWIFSLSQLGRFLGERAEEGGAMILPETAAQKLLVSHGRVVGVRTGDKGRNREGGELANFEAGSDLVAKVTVLAEGTQGHLTGVALDRFDLARRGAAGLGARCEGGLEGRRSRSTASSTRWAGRCATGKQVTGSSAARSSTRWATTWSRSASSSGSTTGTRRSRCTICCRS